MRQALKILFENFWIIRKDSPEQYIFIRRHQAQIQKELRQRFGMYLTVRPHYIQLFKRPHVLEPWMGTIGFQLPMDYALFCLSMAFIEDLEVETPFMLDELIHSLDLLAPSELVIDWTNYNHRKSLVRVIKQLIEFRLIENIQGEATQFEQSEVNQEVLFVTTVQARFFLAQAPHPYTAYDNFDAFWQDIQEHRGLEMNQLLYQRLMMEPVLFRTDDTEEVFARLRNYAHHMQVFLEANADFSFELYKDYAAFTTDKRDTAQEMFPSHQVIDDILLQLATLLRETRPDENYLGQLRLDQTQWLTYLMQLQKTYQGYWSKAFKDMSLEQLGQALIARASSWQLIATSDNQVIIQPTFGRLIGELTEK